MYHSVLHCAADDNDDNDEAVSAMEESSLSESEDDEIISSIRPSKKVIYSSESDISDKPSDGSFLYVHLFLCSVLPAISPDGAGLAGTRMSPFWILLELRMVAVMVTMEVIRRTKLQSNYHHRQTILPTFTHWMPFLLHK